MHIVQTIAQVILLLLLAVGTNSTIKEDIEGRRGKPPLGASGVRATLLATVIVVALLYLAGAFSRLVG